MKHPSLSPPVPSVSNEVSQPSAPREESGWFVYLLSCTDGTLYCGVTTDVERRLAMHNGLAPGGARYTQGRRPVTLAAYAGGFSRSEALRTEARIKKLPRAEKKAALLACAMEKKGEDA